MHLTADEIAALSSFLGAHKIMTRLTMDLRFNQIGDDDDGDCTHQIHFFQGHLLPWESSCGVLLGTLVHVEIGMATAGCWRGEEPRVPRVGCSWG